MNLTRRKTLALIGGGVVVAASAATAIHVTRPLQTALQPWHRAGGYDDPRLNALSYAILAPNPHNRQPWKVDVSNPSEVVLYVDPDRLLPHTDPFNRQITIGLGCFLEVMRIAAAEDGYDVALSIFPEGADEEALDNRPVARAVFTANGVASDPLFAQILSRRTWKDPFDTSREVAPAVVTEIAQAVRHGSTVGGTVQPGDVMALREVTTRALLVEIETPHTFKESVDLFRIGRREVDANPDGIDFTGPLFETLSTFGMMTREGTLDTESTMFAQGKAAVLENAETAMGHIWLTTPQNDRASQIAAGRDWVRLNLAATGLGIGIHPLSQALQEYPEVAAQYEAIHERLAVPGQTVQMLARLGYGEMPAQSPRWPLETKVI